MPAQGHWWENLLREVSQVLKNMEIRDVIKTSSCPANIYTFLKEKSDPNIYPSMSWKENTKFEEKIEKGLTNMPRCWWSRRATTESDRFNECNKIVWVYSFHLILDLCKKVSCIHLQGSSLDQLLRCEKFLPHARWKPVRIVACIFPDKSLKNVHQVVWAFRLAPYQKYIPRSSLKNPLSKSYYY